MDKVRIRIGLKVKEARESAIPKLTQEELAKKAGYSTSYIGMIESGKTSISMKALDKIASALGVKQSYFIEEKNGVFFDEYKDELTLEESKLLQDQSFRPWITLAAEYTKEGYTADDIREAINTMKNILDKRKKPC